MAADQATTIENRQAGMKFTTDETINNEQYAIPVDARQSSITLLRVLLATILASLMNNPVHMKILMNIMILQLCI